MPLSSPLAPKVVLGIVYYSGVDYIPALLASLSYLQYENLEIVIRDQSETGELLGYFNSHFKDLNHVTVIHGKNLFHSGGHNWIIQTFSFDYYVCASVDMLYRSDCIKVMIEMLECSKFPGYTWASCKMLQWEWEKDNGQFLSSRSDYQKFFTSQKSHRIDSCGLGINKFFRDYDVGQAEIDRGQYDHLSEIFGASGAFIMFSRQAIESISIGGVNPQLRLFDERMHYRNDVDLSFRLQWAGNRCLLVSEALVLHDRQVKKKNQSLFRRLISVREKSGFVIWNSYYGWLLVLAKNVPSSLPVVFLLRKNSGLLLTFFYYLFFHPKAIRANIQVFKQRRELALEKKNIVNHKETSRIMQLLK